MKCCRFLSLMYAANDRLDGKVGSEVEVETEREGGFCLSNHRLPSLSAIPTANYLLMSSLSRIDSLHHHHYHLTHEH